MHGGDNLEEKVQVMGICGMGRKIGGRGMKVEGKNIMFFF